MVNCNVLYNKQACFDTCVILSCVPHERKHLRWGEGVSRGRDGGGGGEGGAGWSQV